MHSERGVLEGRGQHTPYPRWNPTPPTCRSADSQIRIYICVYIYIYICIDTSAHPYTHANLPTNAKNRQIHCRTESSIKNWSMGESQCSRRPVRSHDHEQKVFAEQSAQSPGRPADLQCQWSTFRPLPRREKPHVREPSHATQLTTHSNNKELRIGQLEKWSKTSRFKQVER